MELWYAHLSIYKKFKKYLVIIVLNFTDFCEVGTYSHDGLVPCTTCKIGYYQNQMSSQSCQKCPQNTATWRRGAKSIQECQRKYFTIPQALIMLKWIAAGWKWIVGRKWISYNSLLAAIPPVCRVVHDTTPTYFDIGLCTLCWIY